MRRMIRLVQAAKGTRVCCKEEKNSHFVAQMHKAVWHTTLLGLVSTWHTRAPPSLTVSFLSAPFVIFW
jgi:hypothetical protein